MKQFLSSVPLFFFLWIVLLIQSCTSSTAINGRWQIISFDNGRIHVNYSTDTAWLYPAMKKQLEDRDEDTNKILQDSKEAFRSFGFQFNEDGTYEKFISPGKKMEGQYRFSAGKDSIFFHSRPGIANMNEEKYKFEIQGSQLNIWFYAGGMQHALVFQK